MGERHVATLRQVMSRRYLYIVAGVATVLTIGWPRAGAPLTPWYIPESYICNLPTEGARARLQVRASGRSLVGRLVTDPRKSTGMFVYRSGKCTACCEPSPSSLYQGSRGLAMHSLQSQVDRPGFAVMGPLTNASHFHRTSSHHSRIDR
jgi:hypothetical protein